MICLVKFLLHKHEDLSLTPENPCGKARCGGNAINSVLWLVVSLFERVIWEEGTPTEKIPSPDWSGGIFSNLMIDVRGPYCGQRYPRTNGLGCYRKTE